MEKLTDKDRLDFLEGLFLQVMSGIGERLDQFEERLDQLEERLDQLDDFIKDIARLQRDYTYRNDYGFSEQEAHELHNLFVNILDRPGRWKSWPRSDQFRGRRSR